MEQSDSENSVEHIHDYHNKNKEKEFFFLAASLSRWMFSPSIKCLPEDILRYCLRRYLYIYIRCALHSLRTEKKIKKNENGKRFAIVLYLLGICEAVFPLPGPLCIWKCSKKYVPALKTKNSLEKKEKIFNRLPLLFLKCLPLNMRVFSDSIMKYFYYFRGTHNSFFLFNNVHIYTRKNGLTIQNVPYVIRCCVCTNVFASEMPGSLIYVYMCAYPYHLHRCVVFLIVYRRCTISFLVHLHRKKFSRFVFCSPFHFSFVLHAISPKKHSLWLVRGGCLCIKIYILEIFWFWMRMYKSAFIRVSVYIFRLKIAQTGWYCLLDQAEIYHHIKKEREKENEPDLTERGLQQRK